jgi:hypothetical protein
MFSKQAYQAPKAVFLAMPPYPADLGPAVQSSAISG